MNLSINDQELQDRVKEAKPKDPVIFKGENGALYEIIPYDGRLDDTGLSE